MIMNRVITSALMYFLFLVVQAQESSHPVAQEIWEPVPGIVDPYSQKGVPSDAIILLGENLDEWEQHNGKPVVWDMKNGVLTVRPGNGGIRTKRVFGSVQLHIEWRTPEPKPSEKGQNRGNSGVFLMGQYEIQILDSYQNETYTNGQAGSVYKQHIPLVNASLPPLKWQTFDILFEAPEFDAQGNLKKPAYFTVFHNGVLIHNHVKVIGKTVNIGKQKYKAHSPRLPLSLQDHSSKISFRNIWIREL